MCDFAGPHLAVVADGWRDPPPRAVVAVPARDEASRLDACLDALDGATRGIDGVETLLLLNNCTDASAAVAARAAGRLALPLRVVATTLPAEHANAGAARRLAMALAAARLGGRFDGIVLSTDADSRVAPDWLAANLAAIDAGADAVAGEFLPDADEFAALRPAVRLRFRAARAKARLRAFLARRPHDPRPRHGTHSGASIAVRLPTLIEMGGLPPHPVGEDAAFFAAVERARGKVRHDPRVLVHTSCRTVGRAPGGMAATLARWGGSAEA